MHKPYFENLQKERQRKGPRIGQRIELLKQMQEMMEHVEGHEDPVKWASGNGKSDETSAGNSEDA